VRESINRHTLPRALLIVDKNITAWERTMEKYRPMTPTKDELSLRK